MYPSQASSSQKIAQQTNAEGKDWRTVAQEDQTRKKEKLKSETNTEQNTDKKASSMQVLMQREQAVKEQGWRGAQKVTEADDQLKDQISEDGWRGYRLSEEVRALKEQERQEKMAIKSAKRARKAEQAIASWEKQKRNRKGTYQSSQKSHADKKHHANKKYHSSHQNLTDQHDTSSDLHDRKSYKNRHKATKQKKQKQRPPISEAWLKSAGIKYLSRFCASEQHFRFTMSQKIKNAESRESEDPNVHKQWIDAAVLLAQEYGFLDDQKYASALANSYKRKGLAKAIVRQKLRQKKLSTQHIDQALEENYKQDDSTMIDPNLFAAARAAKQKRLGPWGPKNIDYPTLQKQLAKLARRGFNYGIAKQVLQADLEEAERWLLEGDL